MSMDELLSKHYILHQASSLEGASGLYKQAHIYWEGTQFAISSFSLVNRELCSSLLDTGVAELTIVPYEPDEFSLEGNSQFQRLRDHDIRIKGLSFRDRAKRPQVWIRHQWPPRPDPPGKAKWIIMMPWEYSAIPKYFADTFAKAEEIWTPSTFSRNAFLSSGIDAAKIHIIPNGVNTDIFSPQGIPLVVSTSKRFKFLFVGGTIYRKGIDILLESYSRAFTARDDVCLVIKDLGVKTLYKGQTSQALIREFQTRKDAPEVLYLDEAYNENQMAQLYRACDVFVSPYRGEGFSLPTLEAMASGLPVIVTFGGATDDFVNEDVGWLIDAEKRSVGRKVYGHQMDKEAFLLEPDKKHLEALLQKAYCSRPEICEKGIQGALRARENWTWKHSVLRILGRIDALCGTTMAAEAEKDLSDAAVNAALIRKVLEHKYG